MLNSHWTSGLLAELKSTSSSQHWFHSPSQLVGLPGGPSGFLFFLEHFRRVFGCEWALAMRFEEDYQGPESCLGASCAFQQNCPCPSCISVGKMWCTSPRPHVFLSHSLSGSDIEKHDCRGLRWYLGLLFSSLHHICISPHFIFEHTVLASHEVFLCVSALNSGEVDGYCRSRTGHLT